MLEGASTSSRLASEQSSCSAGPACVQVCPAEKQDIGQDSLANCSSSSSHCLGPEWVFVNALGQLNAALRAKNEFRKDGRADWTLRHCFFVNMGALHLQFPNREAAGEESFPVDCQQLLYLVREKYIELPRITKEDIGDRNKSDSLARAIAVIQTLWFTSNSLGRVAEGLFLTTVELTTLAFVFLMTACSICWWRKPMDISRPIVVRVDIDLATVHLKTNAPTPLRGRLPLSYLTKREWFMSQFWSFYVKILRTLRLWPGKPPTPAHAGHFHATDFPELDVKWEFVGAPLVALYSAVFIAAWNFEFPTPVEHKLWRIASARTLAYGVLTTSSADPTIRATSLFTGG